MAAEFRIYVIRHPQRGSSPAKEDWRWRFLVDGATITISGTAFESAEAAADEARTFITHAGVAEVVRPA